MRKDLLHESFDVRTVVWLALALFGCGNSAQPKAPVDAGRLRVQPECDPDRTCPTGQLCALNHCYAACADDTDCSARERCANEGALAGLCIAAADGGVAADPCDQAVCGGATPVCNPRSASCVACTAAEHCSGEQPICDRGRGMCVARPVPDLCQPCNVSADCRAGDAGVSLSCFELTAAFERVCLPTCSEDTGCPAGFECSPGLKACVPRNASCTAYAAARAMSPCRSSVDCSALGTQSISPLSGACRDQHCAFVCLTSADCQGGLACTGAVCVEPSTDAGAPGDAASGV
jgi:hypothetical protein